MNRLSFYILIPLTIILVEVANAQTDNSKPQGLKFGLGAGISGFSYGTSNYSYNAAFNIDAKLKVEIPDAAITPVAFLNYYFLTGSYSSTALNTSVSTNSNINQKILTLGAGLELKLAQGPLSPYLAVDLGYNHIGEVSYAQAPLDLNNTPLNTPSISRTGMDFGGGLEINIPNVFIIDASLKYAILNMFGKNSGEPQLNAVNFNVSILF